MATRDETSDAELVRRSQAGDTEAFDQLVRRHQARTISIAYGVLGDLDAAHDAAQEAFVAAWRALGQFQGQAAFGTWLYRILRNVCLDIIRKRRMRAELALDAGETYDVGPADAAPGPLAEAELDERCALVRRALASLAPHHRELLVLFDIEGMSYQEMCEVVGLPMGTVKSRLNRARHALRHQLAPLLEQEAVHGGPRHGGPSVNEGGDVR